MGAVPTCPPAATHWAGPTTGQVSRHPTPGATSTGRPRR
jgi:hypothetical protein